MLFTITIPVTPFTKKCVTYAYGQGVIKLGQKSQLFSNLSKMTFSENDERAKQYCTESIEVEIPKNLKMHIEASNIWVLGFMLHTYEISCMLNTIEFSVFVLKKEAVATIENYTSIRGIMEDDLSFQTIYKAWQRQKVKKIGKNKENGITKTRKTVFFCYSIPFVSIIKYLTQLYNIDLKNIQGSTLKEPVLYEYRKVILYIAYKCANMSIRQLANEFGIHYPQVHKNINSTEFMFNEFPNDTISIRIEEAFQYLKDKLSPLNIEQLHLLLKYGSNKHHKS